MCFNKAKQTRDSVYARIYMMKSLFLEQGIHFWWLCFQWLCMTNVILLVINAGAQQVFSLHSSFSYSLFEGDGKLITLVWSLFVRFAAFRELENINAQKNQKHEFYSATYSRHWVKNWHSDIQEVVPDHKGHIQEPTPKPRICHEAQNKCQEDVLS